MNKSDLINAISEKAEISKTLSTKFLEALIETISDELKNDNKVQLVGFGSFEVKSRAARKGHNPQTNEEIRIPACKAPVFKAGKLLKEKIQEQK